MRALDASWFVASRTLKNRALFSIRRLKRPRYLASAVVSLIYFGTLFGRNRVFSSIRAAPNALAGYEDVAAAGGAVLLFVVMLLAWAWPTSDAGLEFSEAELQFLFPAPLSRRELMLYKTIRSIVPLLISAVVFRLMARGVATVGGMIVTMFALNSYMMMVRCARARLRLAGIGWGWRLLAVTAVGAGVGLLMRQQLAPLVASIQWGGAHPIGPFMRSAGQILLRFPLAPFFALPHVLARTATSRTLAHAVAYGAGAMLVAVVAFLLASRLDVDFEEGSIEKSQRAQEKRMAKRSGRKGRLIVAPRFPAPFRLESRGVAAVAVFWKNLIAAGRIYFVHGAIALAILAGAVIYAVVLRGSNPSPFALVVGSMSLFTAGALVMFGPSLFRNDLRHDLDRIDLLKTYPLSGVSLVAAEVAAPALLTFLLQTVLAVSGALLMYGSSKSIPAAWVGFVATAMLLLGPAINVLQLLIYNGWALLLPGWSFASKSERGFASSGQGMLMMLGHMLTLGALLLPGALAFGVSFWLLQLAARSLQMSLSLALILPAAILVVEVYLLTGWLGHQFEDLDLANDDLAPRGS